MFCFAVGIYINYRKMSIHLTKCNPESFVNSYNLKCSMFEIWLLYEVLWFDSAWGSKLHIIKDRPRLLRELGLGGEFPRPLAPLLSKDRWEEWREWLKQVLEQPPESPKALLLASGPGLTYPTSWQSSSYNSSQFLGTKFYTICSWLL